MNVRKHAKARSDQSRQRCLRRYLTDDDTVGLWAAKRAQQARSRELVRTGQRSQASMLFIAPEQARAMKMRRRSTEF